MSACRLPAGARVDEEQKLSITPPSGARFKGYEDFLVQDRKLEARVIRYRRERWLTADSETSRAVALWVILFPPSGALSAALTF